MIGSLEGVVIHEEPTGALVLDVNGVGYELSCPVGMLARVARGEGSKVRVFVHTHMRQEALELFGFASLDERATFRALVSVPNVGPKTAITILSALPASELAHVIQTEDKVRLGKVPGIGKKTAERLVLELRGKLNHPHGETPATAPKQQSSLEEKLVLALVGLGYRLADAEKASRSTLAATPGEANLSALLRAALKQLSS